MIRIQLPQTIPHVFPTRTIRPAVGRGGLVSRMESATSSKAEQLSITEGPAQTAPGIVNNVQDGVFNGVSHRLQDPSLLTDSGTDMCCRVDATGSIPLDKCDTSEDWYCCRWDPNCSCNTGKDAIKLAGTQPSTITVIGSTSWPGFTSTTAAFTASPLVSDGTSTNTQTTSSSLSSTSVSTTAASSSASSGTAAGASSTLTGSASSGGGGSSNTGLAAGLGAGLGAAAVLVSILAYFLIRKRRAKNDPTSGTGASYTGTVASNTMQHSSPYAGTQAPSYSSHDHMGSGIQYIKPELAGTGAYDSTQSPTETEGRHRHIGSTHRAELDTS